MPRDDAKDKISMAYARKFLEECKWRDICIHVDMGLGADHMIRDRMQFDFLMFMPYILRVLCEDEHLLEHALMPCDAENTMSIGEENDH